MRTVATFQRPPRMEVGSKARFRSVAAARQPSRHAVSTNAAVIGENASARSLVGIRSALITPSRPLTSHSGSAMVRRSRKKVAGERRWDNLASWRLSSVADRLDVSKDGELGVVGGKACNDGALIKGAPGIVAVVAIDTEDDAARVDNERGHNA